MLIAEADRGRRGVEIRLPGRPGTVLAGRIDRIQPAGRKGGVEVVGEAAGGATGAPAAGGPAPRVFEINVALFGRTSYALLPGQPVVVQYRLRDRPIAAQWWRSLRQLAQRRLGI